MFWIADNINQDGAVGIALLLIGAVTFPVAFSVAVVRHRLYEIDPARDACETRRQVGAG
jgi:hypothetical protein